MEELEIKKYDTIILGGGLSGIGHFIQNENSFLIEKNNHLFGHASSFYYRGFYFDQGAHICHSKNKEWLDMLFIENCNKFHSTRVSNYDDGNWIGYPVQNNLKDIPNKDLAFKEINNGLEKKPRTDNYANWCRDVYGNYLSENYYKRFTEKYWRTSMEDMSTNWLGGRILPIDIDLVTTGMNNTSEPQAVFKEYMYPKSGGFEGLFTKILDKLDHSRISLNSKVVQIDIYKKTIQCDDKKIYKYNKLVSTLPLTELFKFTNHKFDKNFMDSFKYNNLILSSLVFEDKYLDLPDWFYVYDKSLEFSRVMNMSKLQSNRDVTALQFETFRRNDEEYNFEDTVKKIEKDISKFLKIKISKNIMHKFIEYSYVVPTIGIEDYTNVAHNFYNSHDILITGLYGNWQYVWSDKAFMQGFNL